MPIPKLRRPESTRVYRYALTGQVPPLVEGLIRVMIDQFKMQAGEFDSYAAQKQAMKQTRAVHVPSPKEFEPFFLSGRARPAETRPDKQTDRLWLIGKGLPGREESELRELPVRQGAPEGAKRELATFGGRKSDCVVTFTEVGWDDLLTAESRARKMQPWVRKGLCDYFDVGPSTISGLLLSLPSLSGEDLKNIARAQMQTAR